jgi:hypothetical protein
MVHDLLKGRLSRVRTVKRLLTSRLTLRVGSPHDRIASLEAALNWAIDPIHLDNRSPRGGYSQFVLFAILRRGMHSLDDGSRHFLAFGQSATASNPQLTNTEPNRQIYLNFLTNEIHGGFQVPFPRVDAVS